MAVYLAVIFLEFVAYAISLSFKQEQQSKVFLTFGSIPIILVTALRHHSMGTYDSFVYYSHYQNAVNLTLEQMLERTRMEIGYNVFVKWLSGIFENPQWLFFISGVVFTVCVAHFVYKNSEDTFLSLLLYFTLGSFTFSLGVLRQALAMSLCLLSFEYIKKRKFIPFILVVLLASQFHITALVFIPLYFVANIKITALNILMIVGASSVILYFMDDIVAIANDSMDMSYQVAATSGGFVTVIIYALVFALVFFYRKEFFKNKTNGMLLIMASIGLLAYIMRYFTTRATERISFYFFYSIIILLPNTIHCIKDKKERQTVYILTLVLAIALFIYRTYGSTIYPYRFFWDVF